jgi:tRNA modification GTPase
VAVEVSIDFSEEDISTYDPERVAAVSREIAREITELVESESAGRKLRSGIRVTILGPRNAGKSSLYNALLGEERAIVSSLPGTTRDILRERMHIGGFTYLLEDTAGIAQTGCEVEAKGISIGRRAAELAELVLFVVDGCEPVSRETTDEISRLDRAKTIVVLNKSDLGFSAGPGAIAEKLGVDRVTVVSALSGEGLAGLKRRIYEYTVEGETSEIERERIAVNARQAAALREALEAMKRLFGSLNADAPAEIISMEIRAAADACGKVTGRSIADDLLDEIFSRFCIGK